MCHTFAAQRPRVEDDEQPRKPKARTNRGAGLLLFTLPLPAGGSPEAPRRRGGFGGIGAGAESMPRRFFDDEFAGPPTRPEDARPQPAGSPDG